MTTRRRRSSLGAMILLLVTSCRRDVEPDDARGAPPIAASATATSPSPPEEQSEPPTETDPLSASSPPSRAEAPRADVTETRASSGRADRDPDNDHVVGPPDAMPDCDATLRALGVEFTRAELPLRQQIRGIPTCGAHDAVLYRKGPTGLEIRPPALVTCRLASALADLEVLAQELAQRHFSTRLTRVHQGGTYNCRKMARFDLVSEHSYGNAIDVRSFQLADGRLVSVEKHFGRLTEPPATDRARFLRELGEQAFERDVVSVSLGPFWDALHRDHFHFDMARYRVDGSRDQAAR